MEIDLLLDSQKKGIDLVGPVPSSKSWQDRVEGAFDHTQFQIDWEKQVVTCPNHKTSVRCTKRKTWRGTPSFSFVFGKEDCLPCPMRVHCSRAKNVGRTLTLYPKELSGGAKQKTAISRALTSGSTLLLLDEPLGALDLKVRTVLRYELRKLVKDLGLTAIHVTHDQEEALSISDRVVVMKAGRIVEVGPPMQLYLRPKEIFTAKFLGEANFMTGELIESDGSNIKFDVGGLKLNAGIKGEFYPKKGEICVLAIRPEFIDLTSEPGIVNTWACEIVTAIFVGDSMRYEVRVENGVILLVKTPITGGESGLVAGDKAYVTLPEGSLLLYRFPEEGLENALSLE